MVCCALLFVESGSETRSVSYGSPGLNKTNTEGAFRRAGISTPLPGSRVQSPLTCTNMAPCGRGVAMPADSRCQKKI